MQVVNGGVKGRIGFETSGDLPPVMALAPRPVVQTGAGGVNRAIMTKLVGDFERGLTKAWYNRERASRIAA